VTDSVALYVKDLDATLTKAPGGVMEVKLRTGLAPSTIQVYVKTLLEFPAASTAEICTVCSPSLSEEAM
jgi:hypothetical protein